MSKPMGLIGRADLHMHTTASDGLGNVRELLEHVTREGQLDVIAITDHDRLDASLWAYANRHHYPFDIVPGVEVTSAGGHVLALWVTEPIPQNLSLAETAAAIHEQGGLAILAHPFHVMMGLIARNAPRYLLNPCESMVDAGLDGVEVHNAGVMIPGCNLVARWVGGRVPLATLGNSDAHTLTAIGTGRTLFSGHTAVDLRAAIEAQQTVAEGRTWHWYDYWTFTWEFMIKRRGKHFNVTVELDGQPKPSVEQAHQSAMD